MSPPSVNIIGAGISGLVLARCLLRRGIPAVLYERDTLQQATSRHGYGITLHQSAYRPLLEVLKIDEAAFRRKLAVDIAVSGQGYVDCKHGASSFRANRRRLEAMLREGLDVRWGHQLADLKPPQTSGDEVSMTFSTGVEVRSHIVVGADGPHSQLRKAVSPSSEFEILPYVVFNGKRRVPRETFTSTYTPHIDGSNLVEHQEDDILLQFSTNDLDDENVSISYTYSRPARQGDRLFQPNRSNSDAATIHEELFDEISLLSSILADHPPFDEVFNVRHMLEDRLLNWLMRSVLVPQADLEQAATNGIVLVGDAAHHAPILGSYGANGAIKDAMELAEYIAGNGGPLQGFYRLRYDAWEQHVQDGGARLVSMHKQDAANPRL